VNVGDQVTTPHGPATIIEVRGDTEWVFHRVRPRPLVIVRYPGGQVHAWVPSKVKPA